MASRLTLQALLETLTKNVYFQPPSNEKMQYPCILYTREASDTKFAGNAPYVRTKRYQVTVIDRNPDTELADKVEELPYCTLDRAFATEGLNHYVFTLFF
jgi:hypothetical protein